jgi:hypothetical protein
MAFGHFSDLPAIEHRFAQEEGPYHSIQHGRIQTGWPSEVPSYPYHSMDCFGQDDPLQTSHAYRQRFENPHWGYCGSGPVMSWRADQGPVSPPVHCMDDPLRPEQDSSSDGSAWSPSSPSEHCNEMNHRSPILHHTLYSDSQMHCMPYSYHDRSPTISEAMYEVNLQSGSGIALQDVQQYPDEYPEEQFSKPCREDVKILYQYEHHPGSPGVQNEEVYQERYSHATTPCIEDTIKTDNGHAIKEESMSDVENDSGSDYSPRSRNEANGGRTSRKGKPTRSSPRRNSKTKANGKPRSPTNSVVKRHVKRPSKDGISITTTNKSGSHCPHCSESPSTKAALTKHISTAHTRPFTCTFGIYGCPSTFGSKNEWKRHVSTQHLRLGIWRCDLNSCNPNENDAEVVYNDFNRKDLFTQHLRRMHGPENKSSKDEQESFTASLEDAAKRCLRDIRSPPPQSVCGFCPAEPEIVFQGTTSWEARMEHVGRHLESGHADAKKWREDIGLRDWMVKEGLVEEVTEGQFRLVGLQVEDGKSKRAKK